MVKDVLWDRSIANNWHTTLVASYGPSWPGYYAVDVTQPDPGGLASAPQGSPNGPVFLWQLAKMPPSNAPLFAAHSSTPAITTLFVDPGDGNAREIGVAILPGGQNSGPTSAQGVSSCTRFGPKSNGDAAPVGAYPARGSVRCWGTPAAGNAPANTDPVIGRSVTIARLDTGEILRVFMPASDHLASKFPNDTLAVGAGRYTDTPIDSPMTGTPVVYPSDVGTDATRAFIADADGTIWRFDLSNSDPSKWVGELYLDTYNTDVHHSSTATTDGQAVQVPMVTSLDLSGNLVINAGTGNQDNFDANGTYYMYSVTETVQGSPAKLRAFVNWWLNPATVTNAAGERVSGPMTVFDSVFYFATYAAAPQGSQACTSGHGRIWGLDFVAPADPSNQTTLAKGGVARLVPQPANHPQYITPDETDSTLLGVVIPGVTINATPACAGVSSGSDQYVATTQQHSTVSSFQPGQYSVYTQLGTGGTNNSATKQFNMPVPTPMSPTTVDSWAAVLE
jgi:type IV pilus assembly protein PilY1